MAQFRNMFKVELDNGAPPVVSQKQIHYGDVKANRIGVIALMDGQPAPLSGTCSGSAILADGTTVPITGTVSGNTAYVDLPSACYSVEGLIRVFVKLTQSGVTTTLLAAVGTVQRTETGTTIDPGTIIPSVAALIAAIEEARAAIPADYTAVLAAIAPAFSSSQAYSAGDYCWYDGDLYQFTVDHIAGSWDASQVQPRNLTDGMADLRSELGEKASDDYVWLLLASVAKPYDSLTFPVKAGTYCWYQDALYQAAADIDESEEWTAAHWEARVMADDLKSLKTISEANQRRLPYGGTWAVGTFNHSTGSAASATTRIRSAAFSGSFTALQIDAGYKAAIYAWDGSTYLGVWNGNTWEKALHWNTGAVPWVFPREYSYRLLVSFAQDAAITTDESDHVQLVFASDTTLTFPNQPADAKTVGDALGGR